MTGRLTLALDSGAVALERAERIAIFGPPADFDLSALPRERVTIVQGFKPDHDAWAARGYAVTPDAPEAADAAVVVLPRARAAGQGALWAAWALVGPEGSVIVDGAKDHGVESMLRELRKCAEVTPAFSKAHGKVFAITKARLPEAWRPVETRLEEGFVTRPGVFSADGIDPGSRALAAHFTDRLMGRAADLGAGWGYLSQALLAAAPGITGLDLIEADHAALSCARQNVADPRAAFHWADATVPLKGSGYDLVVSNPPFHSTNRADPGLGRAFIRAAAAMLAPRGQFLMVANRHLPYEAALAEAFGEVTELPGPAGFKIFRASRPRKRR